MPTPPLSDKELQRTFDAVKKHGGISGAARKLSLSDSTISHRLRLYAERQGAAAAEHRIVVPELPDPELPIGQVVEHLTKQAERRLVAADARRWVKIPVKSEGPYGIVLIGDPHIDDNGCAWPVLREHIEIIGKTEGLYAAGLGDYQNNWTGRLARLYADQDTSSKTAWRLVEWFIRELGDKLLLLIKGNHDMWQGSGDPLDWMKQPGTLSEDWSVRVEFQMSNKTNFRIIAAHDFPGHSMWNPLHSNQRKARFSGEADLYVAGHRHEWALSQQEDGERHKVYWLARARGYKFIDGYAHISGYHQQRYGASIAAIVNPDAVQPVTRIQCFADVAEAADYLKYLRRRK